NARAGTPTTVMPSGTASTTTAPAPTTHHDPSRTPGRTVAPAPTKAPAPAGTAPASVAPDATWTRSASLQSCSTIAPVLMIAWRPTVAPGCTTAPAKTTDPWPTDEPSAISARGCTSVAKPWLSYDAARRARARLSP